jgi:hypothetical protein
MKKFAVIFGFIAFFSFFSVVFAGVEAIVDDQPVAVTQIPGGETEVTILAADQDCAKITITKKGMEFNPSAQFIPKEEFPEWWWKESSRKFHNRQVCRIGLDDAFILSNNHGISLKEEDIFWAVLLKE